MVNKIIHLDIDYFFAQVEEICNPMLAKHPIAIGSYNSRSVLCTSNYIARKFGVRSAMPALMAQKLCPHLIIVNPQMELYKEYSEKVFDILKLYTNKIQIVSIDEAYLDVTDSPLHFNSATLIAQEIKKRIYFETGLTCSAGVSYNKFLAKIGSEFNKPNGIKVFDPREDHYLSSLKLKLIPGVGREFNKLLVKKDLIYFKDIYSYSLESLEALFGKMGRRLYYFSRGEDNRQVEQGGARKSLSVERTFSQDLSDNENLTFYLKEIYKSFESRIAKYSDRKVKKIFVKIKDQHFKASSYERLSQHYSFESFLALYKELRSSNQKKLRLLGIGVKFHDPVKDHEVQLDLPIEFELKQAS